MNWGVEVLREQGIEELKGGESKIWFLSSLVPWFFQEQSCLETVLDRFFA
jgi:hypothetical protein